MDLLGGKGGNAARAGSGSDPRGRRCSLNLDEAGSASIHGEVHDDAPLRLEPPFVDGQLHHILLKGLRPGRAYVAALVIQQNRGYLRVSARVFLCRKPGGKTQLWRKESLEVDRPIYAAYLRDLSGVENTTARA